MKKITLLLLILCLSFVSYAQYFTEGFEGGTTIPPAGWTHTQTNANETWTINTVVSNTGANSARVAFDAALEFQDETLTTPIIDLSTATNPQVTFFVNMSYFWAVDPNDNYDAIVSVFDGTATTQIWEEADLGVFTSFIWIEVTVDLTAYAGNNNVQLLFNYTGTDGASLNIDDIVVEETPTCTDPSDFVLGTNGITDTTVDIAWTDTNGLGTVFDIEYGPAEFTLGTGTMVNDIATAGYEFTGLLPDTDYEFYITANCTGANGDSAEIGPIGFTSAYDCSLYGFPYSESWANQNAYFSCYTVEDTNTDMLSWTYNPVNDLDGDGNNDNIAIIFPQAANVVKDDWLFTPAISGTAGAEYTVTVTYNSIDFVATANETFDLVITDSPASTAGMQSVIGSYNNITQSGVFGDTGGNDLITQAYTSTATYTATANGDFHVAIHATTPAAGSDVFFILSINITEALSVDEFDSNTFSYHYDKPSETLNLESSSLAFTNIEVYSILGQKVISKGLTNTSESLNISTLNDGVYLAKININGNSKTIKFVKN